MLAAGTFAQVGYTSVLVGLTVLAPALRARYGLSLAEVGVVIAAPNIGAITTLYPWGRAADRFGERTVIAVGLGAAAACIAATASVSSFAALALLLVLAGAFGASVNSASGRAVMHWFDATSRGLALGLRQTAVPISGALTAVALPLLARHKNPRPALLALAALSVVGAAVALLVIREGPVPDPLPLGGTERERSGTAPRESRAAQQQRRRRRERPVRRAEAGLGFWVARGKGRASAVSAPRDPHGGSRAGRARARGSWRRTMHHGTAARRVDARAKGAGEDEQERERREPRRARAWPMQAAAAPSPTAITVRSPNRSAARPQRVEIAVITPMFGAAITTPTSARLSP